MAARKGARKKAAPKGKGEGSAPRTKPKRAADTVERLYEAVHQMAISFEILPGARLNEVELAKRFSVSRTPLRETLNRLATEGLLDFEPNRGFTRRPLTTDEVVDLYEARSIIEVSAIRLACGRASDDSIHELRGYWDEVRKSEDQSSSTLLTLDEQFHERLAGLSDNQELVQILKSINARIHFVRWMDLENAERRSATYHEHQVVLDKLLARDEEDCAMHLRNHIVRRRDQIVEIIEKGVVRLFMR